MKPRRPKRCYGARADQHGSYCRPGRPRCRWRRREAGICRCGAFHFPHRTGSGRCGDLEACDAWANGPASADRVAVYVPDDAPSAVRSVFADLLEPDFAAGGVA